MRSVGATVLIAISLAASSSGQSGSIWLNGVEMRIGMPKADVLSALRDKYTVRKVEFALRPDDPKPPEWDAWNVFRRGDLSEPVALVAFEDGKLNRAEKTAGAVIGAEAADILDQIFHALQGSPGEQHSFVAPVTIFEVEGSSADGGTGLRRFITVYRPAAEGKSVEIQIFKPTDPNAATPSSF